MYDLNKNKSSSVVKPAKKLKVNIFSGLNWDEQVYKKEQDPKRIKTHTCYDSQSDWKEINTELINVKRYDNKEKFIPSEFKQRILTSSINGGDTINDYNNKIKEIKDKPVNGGFKKLKNSSQENLLRNSSMPIINNDRKTSNNDLFNIKQRKLNDLKSSDLFNKDKTNTISKKDSIDYSKCKYA